MVEVLDRIDTYSENEVDTKLMQYQGNDIVVQYYGDMVNEVYKINSSLRFESIPITNDNQRSTWADLIVVFRFRLFELDF